MAVVKLTKNELKKQKDSLKRYQRYLPTLQLKKQQLQLVLRQIEQQAKAIRQKQEALLKDAESWLGVFGEGFNFSEILRIKEIKTTRGNIAGIDIPVFHELEFDEDFYSFFDTSLWVDRGLEFLKGILRFDAELKVLDKQFELISNELRITSQRVNLFEKVKIPETKGNIRKIQIYLGDQQTAAVVRGKIAKNNLVKELAE